MNQINNHLVVLDSFVLNTILEKHLFDLLPGNFLVLNDAFVIIDLDTGVLQVLLLTGVPTEDTLADCPPKCL